MDNRTKKKINQRIKAVLELKTTELDLSELKLTSIPEDVYKLTNLTVLDLSANEISLIPESIGNLTNLTFLDLSANQISLIPESIGNLTKLTYLDLSINQISLIPVSIGNLTKLTHLVLTENEISLIPESIGNLTKLTFLRLTANEISLIPEFIGKLNNLIELYLSVNYISLIPESIGNLTNLSVLDLSRNQISLIPESIGNLTKLTYLDLSTNQISLIPESIGNLTNLISLYLSANEISLIPESIGNLTKLTYLDLSTNQISIISEFIENLTKLTYLDLIENQISLIPESIVKLNNLIELYLSNNPLPPEIMSAAEGGIESLYSYFKSLREESKTLYEAKLVLVGEGKVGKTTLLKALSGKEPRSDEPTTLGINIDIHSFELPHPEVENRTIQINAWDFGGQEVYKITHQFFFSPQTLYLLVWEPRVGVQQCQVEEWLKLLYLRVGNQAKVVIVSTYAKSGNHLAQIDKDDLKKKYNTMIVDFIEIDSLVENAGEKYGIPKLKSIIAQTTGTFEQMGLQINSNWLIAWRHLLGLESPCTNLEHFLEICQSYKLSQIDALTLARLMHNLGHIIYYADDENLHDKIVLKPQWLTKAIGFVLEDGATREAAGVLPDSRLPQIWEKHGIPDEPCFSSDLYSFFLSLMKRFDILYRLPDDSGSLVAQHVPVAKPELPWTPEQISPGLNRITMICEMEEIPTGLMPWLIVRTHPFAQYIGTEQGDLHYFHWQKGTLLKNKDHGQALFVLQGRRLYLDVEASWPIYFMDRLKEILQRLITDNWPGLEDRYHFNVPCRGKYQDKPCTGIFQIDALQQFHEEGDDTYRCEVCRSKQNILELLYGFEQKEQQQIIYQLSAAELKKALHPSFEDIKNQIEQLKQKFASFQSQSQFQFEALMKAIATETKYGPGLFTIEAKNSRWFEKSLETIPLQLKIWCEAENEQHPVYELYPDKGTYDFERPKEWVQKVMPYAKFVGNVIKCLVPIIGSSIDMLMGEDVLKNELKIKPHLDFIKDVTNPLLSGELQSTGYKGDLDSHPDSHRKGLMLLHALLKEVDPNHQNLGLNRIPTQTRQGKYIWVCDQHCPKDI